MRLVAPASCSLPNSHRCQSSSSSSATQHGVKFRSRISHLSTPLITRKKGIDLIHDPIFNKGTGYPHHERDRLGIRGLVPPRRFELGEQVDRVKRRFDELDNDLLKHMYMCELRDRNETAYFRILMDHIDEMAPIIYTPTVGEACITFGSMYRRARGMYFCSEDYHSMQSMVYNWPHRDVDVVVVTDGSRILGLGDLGCHGMGIPIGKSALYVAAGGIHPARILPVTLDLGTDNAELLNDPFYLGMQHPRLKGEEYFKMVDAFMHAIHVRWPRAMVQFEDFQNSSALPLLQNYRSKYCCFNDDIQGTGSVALAGLLCALRAQGKTMEDLKDERIVCLGAGSAGLGVCNSIREGMIQEGMPNDFSYRQFALVDENGLLGHTRDKLDLAQLPYARNDIADGTSLVETIARFKPTILLGLAGAGRTFTKPVIEEMAKHSPRPVIFPLSNPTSKAECTAEEAFTWTNGRAIVASGSPFDPVQVNGAVHHPSQGNNMYIFPGVGLGAVVSQSREITDAMFYRAACCLANYVHPSDIAMGKCYPEISDIREVSKAVAIEVAKEAFDSGLARVSEPKNDKALEQLVEQNMYTPEYQPLVCCDE